MTERSRARRILLVDDSPSDAALLTRYLTRDQNEDYELTTADSGDVGLELVRTLRPDVVLLDYDLPDLDGLEFLDELTRLHDEADLPVVLAITGQSDPRVAAELIRRGALDYLAKNDLTEEVVRLAVRQALRTRTLREDLNRQTHEQEASRAELVASLERASYLASFSELLTRSLDVRSLIDSVALLTIPYVADACFVDVIENGELDRRTLEVSGALRLRLGAPLTKQTPDREAREGVARAIRSSQSVSYRATWLAAVARWDPAIAELLAHGLIGSLIIVPLTFDEEPLGALSFVAMHRHGPHAQGVAEEIGRRASAALANARAFEAQRIAMVASEAAQRRLNTLSSASAVFARSFDWRETMHAFVEVLVPAFCDHASVVIVEDGGRKTFASRSGGADGALALPVDSTLATGKTEFVSESGSSITVPIAGTAAPAVLGALSITATASRRFTLDDIAVAEDLGRRAGMYLTNARLFEREREIARTLQKSLLPAGVPSIEGIEIAAQVIAGAEGVEVGGDWYDIVPLPRGRVAFAIGDVAGRGVLAAATMGQLRSSLRAYALEGLEPSDALARLNGFVLSQERMQFATVALGVLDTASGALSFASAGHLPPLVVESNGAASLVNAASSLPVGLLAETFYEQSEHRLHPGDTLALYTDGLIESRTRSIDEGFASLLELSGNETGAPEALVAKLLGRLASDAGDDVTVLALRFGADRRSGARVEQPPAFGVTYAAIPGSAPLVRHRLARYLEDLGLLAPAIMDAQVAAGEAVANAVEHAYAGSVHPGHFSLRAFVEDDSVVIEVLDRGVWRQRSGEVVAPLLSERGRGLTLMHALAEDVRIDHDETGTRVRLVFPLTPAGAIQAATSA